MNLRFTKYQGAGNDFIIIDSARQGIRVLKKNCVKMLCDRHLGIGADGIIILLPHKIYDFEMKYYNADGMPGSMCGNGGRCAVKAAAASSYVKGAKTRFTAYDGVHKALLKKDGQVALSMNEVKEIKRDGEDYVLDTGSPHYVVVEDNLDIDYCRQMGSAIRHSHTYSEKGINVNFLRLDKANKISLITYERGVEDITLSCGTGAIASALVWARLQHKKAGDYEIQVHNPGGKLGVKYRYDGLHHFSRIWLKGPAVKVFDGQVKI